LLESRFGSQFIMSFSSTDFLIIGGGVIGCATALELATAGARVALLERGQLGGESSWAGAGLLYPLLPWDYRDEVTHLTSRGRGLYPEWIARLRRDSGIDPEYIESGLLVLPPFDRDKALAWAAAHHETLAEVSTRLVEPAVEHAGPALWLPQVAQVRNPRLIQALRGALEKNGVAIHEGAAVRSLRLAEGKAAAVARDGAVHGAGQVIVAAGAWTRAILGELGAALDFRPVRGQMLLYESDRPLLRRIVLQEGVYLIPRTDGHLLVGSTLEETGFDKSVTDEARTALRERAEAVLPALRGMEPVRQWAGLRPGSPDNIPVIGRHPEIGNLWVSGGHFRYGVTMAPASARLLADLALGRDPRLDPAPYAWPGA
jgi:glycine oxidase